MLGLNQFFPHEHQEADIYHLMIICYKVESSIRKWIPTAGAIMKQAKRAAYIAGLLWGRADTPHPELPPLTEWGYLLII